MTQNLEFAQWSQKAIVALRASILSVLSTEVCNVPNMVCNNLWNFV